MQDPLIPAAGRAELVLQSLISYGAIGTKAIWHCCRDSALWAYGVADHTLIHHSVQTLNPSGSDAKPSPIVPSSPTGKPGRSRTDS